MFQSNNLETTSQKKAIIKLQMCLNMQMGACTCRQYAIAHHKDIEEKGMYACI